MQIETKLFALEEVSVIIKSRKHLVNIFKLNSFFKKLLFTSRQSDNYDIFEKSFGRYKKTTENKWTDYISKRSKNLRTQNIDGVAPIKIVSGYNDIFSWLLFKRG